jgi:hypothetical protein
VGLSSWNWRKSDFDVGSNVVELGRNALIPVSTLFPAF